MAELKLVRRYNGKRYHYYGGYTTKEEAKVVARSFRKIHNYKVVQESDSWAVWLRKKASHF